MKKIQRIAVVVIAVCVAAILNGLGWIAFRFDSPLGMFVGLLILVYCLKVLSDNDIHYWRD